jgi:branched-chain amino acid transport system substrate-binding protein
LPNHRRFVAALGALALVGSSLACGSKSIRFGAVLPLSGYAAVYGQSIQKGADLAIEVAQKDPKFAGKLEYTTADSGSDPARARAALEKAFDDGALAAVGGVTSAEALAMVEIADEKGRVLVSPSASSPQLSGVSSNFFRIFPSDFAEGTVMARYAFDNLHLKQGVVLAKEETYAKGIQKVFGDEFQRKGGKILETVEYPEGTSDFAALCERVVTLKPDFAYLAAYADEVSGMIRHLRAQQFVGLILTTSSFAAAETISKTGPAAERVYFTQSAFETTGDLPPAVQGFVTAYRARYRTDPDLYAAHGFDAVNVLLEAYRQGGTTPLSFWKGMRNVREFPGVTGTLQFDDKGDVAKFPHVYVVTDGKAIDVEGERQRQIEEARRRMREIEESIRKLQNQGG